MAREVAVHRQPEGRRGRIVESAHLDGVAGRDGAVCRAEIATVTVGEIARKDHRRIEMALKLAHFPAVKELAGFDFEAQPSIDPKQIRDPAASCWIANGENGLLLGPLASARRTRRSRSGGRRSLPDIRCSSRRRRRWSPDSPRCTASGAWTRSCWRCRSC